MKLPKVVDTTFFRLHKDVALRVVPPREVLDRVNA